MDFLRDLKQRDSLLYHTGLAHFIFFGLFLLLSFIDNRQVLGINTWVKPMKFALSIGLYVWTMGWFMAYLKGQNLFRPVASWSISLTMIIEMVLIAMQAGRGVQSHFNHASNFDSAVFGFMGIAIFYNTVINIFFLYFIIRTMPSAPSPAYKWSVVAGLSLFILGALVGPVMTSQQSHAVGVPDGGAGLPFLNWSVTGGDLRAAHFLGMHALQILPLSVFFLQNQSEKVKWGGLGVLTILYMIMFGYVFLSALAGQPLITMSP